MKVQVEIGEDGILKVKDHTLHGKTIVMSMPEGNNESAQETNWEAIKEIVKKADKMDFPRRTHEEIIRDLHEARG